jgi:hypothetical protein
MTDTVLALQPGGPDDGHFASQATPAGDLPDLIRVRVRWSEIVTREAVRELDATRIRRCGYDPTDPESIKQYLEDADDFNGDDWYPWHSEYGEHARRIDTDHAEICSVTTD